MKVELSAGTNLPASESGPSFRILSNFHEKAVCWKRKCRLEYARLIAGLSGSDTAISRLVREQRFYDRCLSRRGDFGTMLAGNAGNVKRIFVMGCGRSGTWLLYSLLTMVKDAYILFEEVDVGRFAQISSRKPIHILKRDAKSFRTATRIPDAVGIVWIVRHPFDVVSSYKTDKYGAWSFHIGPDRWNNEMNGLRRLLEQRRDNSIMVRYEDLVADPDATLSKVADAFDVAIGGGAQAFIERADIPADVARAMHGLRSVSPSSIGRWRTEPARLKRVAEVEPLMRDHLQWVGERFGYDLALP